MVIKISNEHRADMEYWINCARRELDKKNIFGVTLFLSILEKQIIEAEEIPWDDEE